MTLHIKYDHKCSHCYADYIPYNDVPCPKCGRMERERFDFIPKAIDSIIYNIQHYGRCTPPVSRQNLLDRLVV